MKGVFVTRAVVADRRFLGLRSRLQKSACFFAAASKMPTRSPARSRAPRTLSVVVPCYEEALNVKPLTTRLFKALRAAKLEAELLLVDDDSGQGTVDTLAAVAALQKDGYAVRAHVRRRHEGSGLSSAVVLGIGMARHAVVLVMDADLQHEPESVPAVAAPVLDGAADFSVGSRHVGGGEVDGSWPLARRVISWGATALARPLTACSDPMSGFFCLRRDTFDRGAAVGLNPMGYKIGLELMVRCGCARVAEVPITFRDREAGASKLTMKQNVLYLRHLAHLYAFAYPKTLALALAALVALAAAAVRLALALLS